MARISKAYQEPKKDLETELVDLLADYFGASSDYMMALGTTGSLYILGGPKLAEPLIGLQVIGSIPGSQALKVRVSSELDDLKVSALVFILKARYPINSQYSEVLFAYNPGAGRIMEGAEAATYLGRTNIIRGDLN